MFETASFHIVKPCNMSCKFCYATFQDMRVISQIDIMDVFDILEKLKEAGLEKITFAGGEPLLYKRIHQSIKFSKSIGLTTSIITNGSLLTDKWLDQHVNLLDWIGISVDSINPDTNQAIGRSPKVDYYDLVQRIKSRGYKLKINTVVNRFNQDEDITEFINFCNPDRWKVFDTLKVIGQNDKEFEGIKSTRFKEYVSRNQHPSMVVEDNEAMTGSYLLIDPQGRLFENSSGKHTYSSPLHDSNMEDCLKEISLNRDRFISRGGIYKW